VKRKPKKNLGEQLGDAIAKELEAQKRLEKAVRKWLEARREVKRLDLRTARMQAFLTPGAPEA
jgi:hypothetical protein